MFDADWLEGKRCAQCGKEFEVLYPHLYRYRRGCFFLCSWSCLRAYDKSEEEKGMNRKRLTLEQKKKAVEIAIAGGNPFDYLAACGSKDAYSAWKQIKNTLQDADPELYAKLPKRIAAKREAPKVKLEIQSEELTERTADEARKVVLEIQERQEKPKRRPLKYDGFEVMAIKNEFGQFRYDAKFDLLDWTSPDGEEVSFSPECWRLFATEALPKAMGILGVDVKI